MDFTYDDYRALIASLRTHHYCFRTYLDWQDNERCVILRHDIDNDIKKALQLAQVERDLGVRSTFFVLVTTDFYNVFSMQNERLLKQVAACGHDIGLHFDEVRYPEITTPEDAVQLILREVQLLELALGKKVSTVSMHRPSKMILEVDLQIPGIINSYGQTYFKEFKYLSDSRRRWREPVDEIIAAEKFEKLHILTHAIWYNDRQMNIHDSISQFVNGGNRQRYEAERENITDLASIMREDEILE